MQSKAKTEERILTVLQSLIIKAINSKKSN